MQTEFPRGGILGGISPRSGKDRGGDFPSHLLLGT